MVEEPFFKTGDSASASFVTLHKQRNLDNQKIVNIQVCNFTNCEGYHYLQFLTRLTYSNLRCARRGIGDISFFTEKKLSVRGVNY